MDNIRLLEKYVEILDYGKHTTDRENEIYYSVENNPELAPIAKEIKETFGREERLAIVLLQLSVVHFVEPVCAVKANVIPVSCIIERLALCFTYLSQAARVCFLFIHTDRMDNRDFRRVKSEFLAHQSNCFFIGQFP